MSEPYNATFPEGSTVRVIPKAALESFARNWKYHHELLPEQMGYAGMTATVKKVGFYHGGDQLYELDDVPGIWNEPCLMSESTNLPQPASPQLDWIAHWQRVARRIRVPLGFVTAALYLFELWRRAPQPSAVAWSLALVLPGLWLRGYAAGYVKKNRELTVTGPYAYTRNPLYLGSMLIAAGFAVALMSWPVALVLALGFGAIYVPVIASEERFLRATFGGFDEYCKLVPRLMPRLTPARRAADESAPGAFSLSLYIKHREYNAGMGAAFLYLSLLLLRPALAALGHGPQ